MGGVGMPGGDDLGLPYPWIARDGIIVRGRWMYPPGAVARVVGLVRSGLLDLTNYEIGEFDLDDVNEAVAHAAAHDGAFRMTVARP